MAHDWSTDDVSRRERDAYWREAVCRTFVSLDVIPERRSTFSGRLRSTRVGGITVATIDADPMGVKRTPATIAELRQDDLLLALHIRGSATGSQDGRRAALSPGDVALFDATRPYRVDFHARGHFLHVVLQFPRDGLEQRINHLERRTATAANRTIGAVRLATRYLIDFAREAPSLPALQGQLVAANALDMIALALDPTADGVDRTVPLVRAAQQFILRNLGDPALSPAVVASAHHVSVRTLYSAFQKQLGVPVSEWVQSQRFRRIREDLQGTDNRGFTVAEIGRRHGVTSAAYLTRGYRARFGRLPSEDRPAGAHA